MATAAPQRTYSEHFGAVHNPANLIDTTPVKRPGGTVTPCAELVKQEAGAPQTQPNNWKKGMELTPAVVKSLPVGTPIASGWTVAGFYPNEATGQHAGIFSGLVQEKGVVVGFKIVEQYNNIEKIAERVVYFDPTAHGKRDTYFYNGTAYATIQW
jgi:hypothetical protein